MEHTPGVRASIRGRHLSFLEERQGKLPRTNLIPGQAPGGLPQKRGDSSDVEEGQEAVPRHRANRQQGEEPEGVYIISVAARILEMHPQTLRKYERAGLVNPSRTEGMLRLYSEADILRLRLIKHLVENLGLNLAGVELALSLVNQVMNMLQQLSYLEQVNPHDLFDERLEDIFNIMDMPFR